MTQMNYLNRALDTYNTAIVSSIYYVFFTVLTIAASVIMYRDWQAQSARQIGCQLSGFVLIVVGVVVLHVTKDAEPGCEDGISRLLGTARPAALAKLHVKRGDSAYMRVRAHSGRSARSVRTRAEGGGGVRVRAGGAVRG